MDATGKLQDLLARQSIWKKSVEADITANFQMLVEVFRRDRAEIQNSLSVSLKREICEHLETLQNSSKVISILMALKLNHESAILFFLI
jgi:nicotinic acid phosphoribosyltransferase